MGRPVRYSLSVWLFAALVVVGCGGADERLSITFPNEASFQATSVVAVTAFEPFVIQPDATVPDFVTCEKIGVFPPPRIVDPDNIKNFPNLGEVLHARESKTFPFEEGEFGLGIQAVKKDNPNNPWGAVMVYIEARGEVRAPDDQGGGQVSATLLAGCYCVRTLEGSHPDRRLDDAVKEACVEPLTKGDSGEAERVVELKPVAAPEFRLAACGVQELTAPRNQLLSPGPAVCLETTRCDDAPLSRDCFKCTQPCSELDDMRNVPVEFTLDQPGGRSTPASQIVLSDKDGRARGTLTVDDCSSDITVHARVLGRNDGAVSFTVKCVDAVERFSCSGERDLAPTTMVEPVAMTRVPGGPGEPDYVALLSFDGTNTFLEVRNPVGGPEPSFMEFPGESARTIHGFYYSLGGRPGEESVPALAVVTSVGPDLKIRLFKWESMTLVPHDGGTGELQAQCTEWLCGSRERCDPMNHASCPLNPGVQTCNTSSGQCQNNATRLCVSDDDCYSELCLEQKTPGTQMTVPVCIDATPRTAECPGSLPTRCSCKLRVEFQTEVSMATNDLDGDGKSDLAIATSSGLPVNIYYSSLASGPGLYDGTTGCRCGRYGQAPAAFEVLNLGGASEPPELGCLDLVIGAPGGAFVKYCSNVSGEGPLLTCGQPARFGDLVPVRDVLRGRFRCNPLTSEAACPAYEDVVLVAAKSLGGGSFDDPGTIRVIFGADRDLSLEEDLFARPGSNVELVPLTYEDRMQPKDPRTAAVGDVNGDGHDDLAVLFASQSREVHVWLGGSNGGLGEVEVGIVLDSCSSSMIPNSPCAPLREFAMADLDADGRSEVVVVCDPTADNPRIRWFEAVLDQ